jgi:hypothetical protein
MVATAAPAPDPSPPSAAPEISDTKGLLVVGGGALVVVLIIATFVVRTHAPAPVVTARPNPPPTYPPSNGLTKETNDFLKLLSRQQPAKR